MVMTVRRHRPGNQDQFMAFVLDQVRRSRLALDTPALVPTVSGMSPEDVISTGPLHLPLDLAPLGAGRLPDDPVAFVAAAESVTNERELDAVGPLYAPAAAF
jgi:hypothetical protein